MFGDTPLARRIGGMTGAAVAALLLTATPPAALFADGGAPQISPESAAEDAYNRGLKYRDKAWELTEELDSANAGERAKLERKIEKEYDKAIRAFQTAIRSKPTMYQAHSDLGYALRKSGRYEEALAAYDTALELQPAYTEAIEYRAEAYLGLDRLEEAKEAYMELFRIDRQRADLLMEAMARWVGERTEDPRQLSSATVEEFAGWVEERGGLAKQTASLGGGEGSSWD